MDRAGLSGPKSEHPDIRVVLTGIRSPARVLEVVMKLTGIAHPDLCGTSRAPRIRAARCVAAAILVRHTGYPQSQIGKLLGGRSYTSVGRLLSQLHGNEELSALLTHALSELKTVQRAP